LVSLQWQAGLRQGPPPTGLEPDKNNWGWNWLERWMAVRPWENRLLDPSTKDGPETVKEHKTVQAETYGGYNKTAGSVPASAKKPVSSTLNKARPSQSEGSGSSSTRSASAKSKVMDYIFDQGLGTGTSVMGFSIRFLFNLIEQTYWKEVKVHSSCITVADHQLNSFIIRSQVVFWFW
jgi:hypothetical protein